MTLCRSTRQTPLIMQEWAGWGGGGGGGAGGGGGIADDLIMPNRRTAGVLTPA